MNWKFFNIRQGELARSSYLGYFLILQLLDIFAIITMLLYGNIWPFFLCLFVSVYMQALVDTKRLRNMGCHPSLSILIVAYKISFYVMILYIPDDLSLRLDQINLDDIERMINLVDSIPPYINSLGILAQFYILALLFIKTVRKNDKNIIIEDDLASQTNTEPFEVKERGK